MTRRGRIAVLLFLGAVAVYTSTGPAFLSGDVVPARYLPISILREGDFDLDEFTFLHDDSARVAYASPRGYPYFIALVHGHYFSRFSPGAGVLAVPVYALPVLAGVEATSRHLWLVERLAAASLIAASAVFLFLALCERTREDLALLIAALYAFGTGSFSMTSQTLWEQTATQFFLAAALLCIVRAERAPVWLWWAGAALAGATAVRPADLLITAPMGCYLLVRHRRGFVRVLLGGMAPTLAWLAHNYANFGMLIGSDRGAGYFAAYVFGFPYFKGLLVMLLGPSSGLFVFSPFLVVALVGVGHAWRHGPPLLRWLSVCPVLLASLYARYIFWDGGWSYGPRFLLDVTAILCLFLVTPLEWIAKRRGARLGFLALGVVSVGIHTLGAYFFDPAWDGRLTMMEEAYDRRCRWRDSQIPHHVRHAYRRLNALRASWGRSADSARTPDRLAARYEADTSPRRVRAGDALAIPVRAVNTGGATWLDKPPGYQEAVRLCWRMVPPAEPGDCTLRIGLVSEQVVFFHDRGVPQLQVAVHVTAP
jgi:hypothetical protein